MNLCTASSGDEAVDTVTGTSHCVLLPASIHTYHTETPPVLTFAHLSQSLPESI